jgi:N-acetylglucosamine-6-sulfatase
MGASSPAPRRTGRPFLGSIALIGFAGIAIASHGPALGQPSEDEPPSIVLIVTDDQRWDTLWAMPEVERLLVDPGVTFSNAFTTSPLCCPARASILTGAYPHTTGVYTQALPHGGFKAFDDSITIATVLDEAGYTTGFFGKYIDSFQADALSGYVPPGWDRFVGFVHAEYFGYGLTVDGEITRYGEEPRYYSTDVLATRAEAFVRSSSGPIFAVYAPAAPHAPAVPAPADRDLFSDLTPWRPPSFDEEDRLDKPGHIRGLRPLGAGRIEELDTLRRNQYRSLQAVDRAVGRLVDALADTGRLDDALIVFTSDNGLLWGEHRWLKKEVPYEEAIRVPLVVRADAIAVPHVDGHLVANIDLAPTFAEAAGVELPDVDGQSLAPLIRGELIRWRPAVLIEHVRGANPVPTFCAVRTPRYLFARYSTGEIELYDLQTDPAQLENVAYVRPVLESRLETALQGLCVPAPPGFEAGPGLVVALGALTATICLGALARIGLARWSRD